MDALTFFASIINSLAWPAVVTTAIVVFRVPISQVVLSLKRLKYQDLELDFEKKLAELKTEVDQVALPTEGTENKELSASASLQTQIEQISLISPASAVILAWNSIESELQKTVMRLATSADYPPNLSAPEHIQFLKRHNLIAAEMYDVLQKMWGLRNQAVHTTMAEPGIYIYVADALEYSELTTKIIVLLQSLTTE